MASVDYAKLGGAAGAKADMRHCCTDERLKRSHSNADIDKAKTADNVAYGAGGSYADLCRAYDERVAYLDATTNTNRRKDRQTCFSLYIPRPGDLTDPEKIDDWAADVYQLVVDRCGADNVLGGILHKDEVHDYLDHGEQKTSREHLHIFIVPEVNGSLNGKRFSSRAAMKAMNQAIEAMTLKKYGVRFMTGEKKKSQTVEQLKAQSMREELERTRETLHKAQEELSKVQDDKQTIEDNISLLQARYDALSTHMMLMQMREEELDGILKKKRKAARDRDERER